MSFKFENYSNISKDHIYYKNFAKKFIGNKFPDNIGIFVNFHYMDVKKDIDFFRDNYPSKYALMLDGEPNSIDLNLDGIITTKKNR